MITKLIYFICLWRRSIRVFYPLTWICTYRQMKVMCVFLCVNDTDDGCVCCGLYRSWGVCVCFCRLNLRELGPLAAHMRWFVWLMAAAGTIYVFNYHEKYVYHQMFLSMREVILQWFDYELTNRFFNPIFFQGFNPEILGV